MSILYKYMPLRLSFFDDPLLRLTPPSELNDPFDSKPTQVAIERKMDFFFKDEDQFEDSKPVTEDSELLSEDIRDSYEDDLKNQLNQYGVISLTEDPHNLLMWSHYANEHSGIIIAISCDSTTFNYHDKFTENCGVSKKEPMRVTYSNNRPGYDMPEDTIYEYFEHNFYSHIAMTKGNDWIYEKEHRYLIRLTEIDVAIVNAYSAEWANQKSDDVTISHIEGNTYKVEASSENKRNFLSWFIAIEEGKKEISDVKKFKRLNSHAVTGVYFGSRVSEDEIARVKCKIEKSAFFENSVNMYKSIESQNRFEINFEPLY